MSRFEAQSHLQGPGNEDGDFLIRLSEKDDVGYVLSGETWDRKWENVTREVFGVRESEEKEGAD